MKNKNIQPSIPNPQSKKGFTLIELLVVVAIIGLLSSIVLVGLGAFRGRARDARRLADLRQTQNSLELFYTANNVYPALIGADSWGEMTAALTASTIGVTNVARDPLPLPHPPYVYGVSANLQNYVLGATLEDATNPALNDDVDTPQFGITTPCADPAYCVQF